LRRDLASAPIVAYESLIGGWSKRVVDIALTVISAPIWLPAMLIVAAIGKLALPGSVFVREERIGYGGGAFQLFSLRLSPPTAVIERLRPIHAANGEAPSEVVPPVEGRTAKWREALERLPQLFNVLHGDMSLVGPRPLVRAEVESLRTARRYYLSARPGVLGIGSGEGDENVGGPYKVYALSWSLAHDVIIVWRALRDFRDRGELWRPSWRLRGMQKSDAHGAAALERRRSS
jgi:lipopolysaccharide/colanic/teichoic acid biosynthesis glycosyltransferase